MSDNSQRKADHLDLTTQSDVGFRQTTSLFECVRLVHNALPELDFDRLETGVTILGKRLRAPILIAAMTGGTPRAERINKELASIAQEFGYAFGLGSQRAMLQNPSLRSSFSVRDVAPSALVLGNIGIVQARACSTGELADLVGAVGADALCVHLNPAMELIQSDGDRDFTKGLETLARLVENLGVPIVAKETGCGLSVDVLAWLKQVGIAHVDVSGAGGTSWVGVETLRAADERRGLGRAFWEWGIPTAASVSYAARCGFETIFATGGVQHGLDIAKALALGASAGGIARKVLVALETGGRAAAVSLLSGIETEIRAAMLLTGCNSPRDLYRARRIVTGELEAWITQS